MKIVKLEGGKADDILPISNNQGAKLLLALSKVYDFEDDLVLPLQIFRSNLNDLNSFQNYQDEVLRTKGYDLSSFSILKLEYSRRVQNALSSFVSFLDISKRSIEKWSSTRIMESFETEKNRLFDSHFCYRFLSKLRVFGVHYSLPFHELFFTFTERGTQFSNYNMVLHRDRLLEFSNWGSILKKEIPDLPEKIDISPYFEQLWPLLDRFNRDEVHTVFMKGSFDPSLLNKVYTSARDKSGSHRVAIMYPKNKKETSIQMFPATLLEHYRSEIIGERAVEQ